MTKFTLAPCGTTGVQDSVPTTVPMLGVGIVVVMVGVVNVADTVRLPSIVIRQELLVGKLSQPTKPPKMDPAAVTAVSVTTVLNG